MAVLNEFCGEIFTVFDKDKKCFSECFIFFVFSIVQFTLLAMTSSYYLGRLQIPDVKVTVCTEFKTRLAANSITLLIIVVNFFTIFCFEHHIHPVFFLLFITQSISLMVHSFFLKRLGSVHFLYKYGPFYTVASWLLCFIYFVLNCERNVAILIHSVQHGTTTLPLKVNAACSILTCLCQISYFIALAIGNRRYRTVSFASEKLHVSINSISKEHLLVSDTYSEIPQDEEVEECPADRANILSKFIFYWVRPLLQRGSYRTLQKAEDTFVLPKDLSVTGLVVIFLDKLKLIYNQHCIEMQRNIEKNILLKTLHQCYGCVYYSLGILKLLADILGFAGPLLLNRLISFIEQPQTDYTEGYWYASGLFLSTLIGSFLTTHFDYQVLLLLYTCCDVKHDPKQFLRLTKSK